MPSGPAKFGEHAGVIRPQPEEFDAVAEFAGGHPWGATLLKTATNFVLARRATYDRKRGVFRAARPRGGRQKSQKAWRASPRPLAFPRELGP
jgi:hypothetical protein